MNLPSMTYALDRSFIMDLYNLKFTTSNKTFVIDDNDNNYEIFEEELTEQ